MATGFPTSLDSFPVYDGLKKLGDATQRHTTHHTDQGDAIEALQAKVGANGSTVTTSIDYKLRNSFVTNVLDHLAVASGTADNTAAFQAALNAASAAGGGIVYIPAGTWGLSGQVVVGSNTCLRGAGKRATTIKCNDAVAQVMFGAFGGGDRRGLSGNFTVNGNSVATQPLVIASGANSDYIDILSTNSADIAVLISAVQNIGVYSLEAQQSPKGIVFDRGCKNITVTRGTVNDCDIGVLVRMNEAHPTNANNKEPQRIVISDVLNESTKVGAVNLQVNAGNEIHWVRGALNAPASGICVKTELLDPAALGAGVGSVFLDGVKLSGGTGGTAIRAQASGSVFLLGGTKVVGAGTTFDHRNTSARFFVGETVDLASSSTARFSSTVSRTEGQSVLVNGAYDVESTSDYSAADATTYIQPTDLTIHSLPAQSVWEVEADLLFDGSATGDAQVRWDLPTGATFEWTTLGPSTAGTLTLSKQGSTSSPTFGLSGAGTTVPVRIRGLLKMGTGSGAVFPKFRQGVTDATVTKMLTGSRWRCTRVRGESLT